MNLASLTRQSLSTKLWWSYLEADLQELLCESLLLYQKAAHWRQKFHDYSFVVFPAAKAFEGFLKKLFLDMGFITPEDYFGKRFRIGKSLNPSLDKTHQDESWVYDDLTKFCQGRRLPDQLWQTWKESRNLVFHWFPNEVNTITLSQAGDRISLVISAIDEVFVACGVQLNNRSQ